MKNGVIVWKEPFNSNDHVSVNGREMPSFHTFKTLNENEFYQDNI